jgi:8-oxo-dGTP diphosphatase
MPRPETPLLAVDCVVLDEGGRLLMIRRKSEPFKGYIALPGGFVEIGETVEEAARRELLEETQIKAGKLRLVGVYSDPRRDPRGHTCSVAFLTQVEHVEATAGDDAEAVAWVSEWRGLKLAFDHSMIIADALKLLAKPE